MRHALLSAGLSLILGGAVVLPAAAQVTVDQRALEPLTPVEPGAAAPAKRLPAKPAARVPAKPAAKPAVPAKLPPAPPPPPPVVPPTPPPLPVIPPPIVVPIRPVPAPVPAVVTADAPGEATAIGGGIRITFGAGRSDLNAATSDALRGLAKAASGTAGTTFSVTAYASGTPEDISAPRRLSLSRALTVRSVLIAQGFASARIYVKALGASAANAVEGPADRVDVLVIGLPASLGGVAPSPASAPAPASVPAPAAAAPPTSPPPAATAPMPAAGPPAPPRVEINPPRTPR